MKTEIQNTPASFYYLEDAQAAWETACMQRENALAELRVARDALMAIYTMSDLAARMFPNAPGRLDMLQVRLIARDTLGSAFRARNGGKPQQARAALAKASAE